MILKDGGHGCTDFSLEFFWANRHVLGEIIKVEMQERTDGRSKWNTYPFRIYDDQGNEMWFSGCQSGYGGEGPHGTFQILQELGIKMNFEEIKKKSSFILNL